MSSGSIARRYSGALIELAREEGKLALFGEELDAMAKLMNDLPELFNALKNPAVPKENRRAIMDSALSNTTAHPFVKNFMLMLVERRRIEFLPEIAKSYGESADEIEGRVRARVVSAMELNPAQVDGIKNALQAKLGKTVILETQKDASLIAGLVAYVGNHLYDFSIKSQLHRLQKDLIK